MMIGTTIQILCARSLSHIHYGHGSLLYFELESLHRSGAIIDLHVLHPDPVSEKIVPFCRSIQHYEHITGHKAVHFDIPFEVATRLHPDLEINLNRNQDPVLIYGWEATGLVFLDKIDSDRVHLRVTGIAHVQSKEYQSYKTGLLQKIKSITSTSSHKLLRYEDVVMPKPHLLPLHEKDIKVIEQKWQRSPEPVPIFLSPIQVSVNNGMGNYCFYFGDFSDPEHEKAAIWLLEEVFSHVNIPFVVAGKSPSAALQKIAHKNLHTCLVADPDEDAVEDLIRKAHIQILPMLSVTGLKSEIYHALLHGRHCLYHGEGYACPLVRESCHEVKDARHARELIPALFSTPFHEESVQLRNKYFFDLNRSNDRAAAWMQQAVLKTK